MLQLCDPRDVHATKASPAASSTSSQKPSTWVAPSGKLRVSELPPTGPRSELNANARQLPLRPHWHFLPHHPPHAKKFPGLLKKKTFALSKCLHLQHATWPLSALLPRRFMVRVHVRLKRGWANR